MRTLPDLPDGGYTVSEGYQLGRAAARFGKLPGELRRLPPAELAECIAIDIRMRQEEERLAGIGLLKRV